MTLYLGHEAPDFEADTTEGRIRFHEWLGGQWAVLFSHPKDFTPVCTTELGRLARLKTEFEQRKVKLIGLSVDSLDDHLAWASDIAEIHGTPVGFPIIADPELHVAKLYEMIHADTVGKARDRTARDNATIRAVFVIAPDRTIRLTMTYPMTTGRNFDELLRVIDSLQLAASGPLATPADWRPGDRAIIVTSLSDEEARARFPQGFETVKPYLRYVQPEKP
ncbi:MAG TPA: peroxidase [Gammaproteobacteria bacterium]|nr:peroxidase [Gammaproteobacteria bacterium]